MAIYKGFREFSIDAAQAFGMTVRCDPSASGHGARERKICFKVHCRVSRAVRRQIV